ncbi:hypothetical protein C1D09_003380 [Mesorhizobium intechi]|uniref:Uncharacterized protein n=1 Tax=Mesorhizobium intechi TaxID=537601 RepID=A0A8T9AXJ0_9HYPH|nr:hypothetical protein [Mesorhizobium intechi]TSE13530.1 hypothetical protein C1D09_003380 [Mesorhizobium intechi]
MPADIHVRRRGVYGPNEIRFGTVSGPGLYNYGQTTIAQLFVEDPDAFPDISPSLQRVIQSVSDNEGKMEAINTYDNSFLSVGVFQWTAGATTGAGEIAGLLAVVDSYSPGAFNEYFGSEGLGYELNAHGPNDLVYGYLSLNGNRLNNTDKKRVLREHIWAYRFWRASHDQEVRRAEIRLAVSRVNTFYPKPVSARSRFTMADYISSEYGVALVLDEHVNRPGHVPGTLMQGVRDFVASTGKRDPASWNSRDEAAVLRAYIDRRARTNMTDSTRRADRVKAYVTAGALSADRHSFVP